MRVTYTGPLDAVEIAELPGVFIENGKGVEVDDELGERLIEQDVWRGPRKLEAERKAAAEEAEAKSSSN